MLLDTSDTGYVLYVLPILELWRWNAFVVCKGRSQGRSYKHRCRWGQGLLRVLWRPRWHMVEEYRQRFVGSKIFCWQNFLFDWMNIVDGSMVPSMERDWRTTIWKTMRCTGVDRPYSLSSGFRAAEVDVSSSCFVGWSRWGWSSPSLTSEIWKWGDGERRGERKIICMCLELFTYLWNDFLVIKSKSTSYLNPSHK